MKKLFYSGCVLAVIAIASCNFGKPKNNAPDVYTDTLTYHLNKVKSRADDCGTKPDSTCTVAEFNYPVFDSNNLLNDSIYRAVSTLFDPVKGAAGLQLYVANFLNDYNNFKKENKDFKGSFELNISAEVVRQDSSLTTIQVDGYQFLGGAHGGSRTRYINWNTQSNKDLRLADILKPGYEQALNAAAEKIFRKQEKLTATASLEQNYFFKDAKFHLNNNFLITPIGLHFLYNEYDIKPYAAGQTTLLVPYKDILSLLQPNTVVARYTK